MTATLSHRVVRLPFRPRTEAFLLSTLEASAPSRFRQPIDLALLIDRSSSMRGSRLYAAVEAAKAAVTRLGLEDRVAIITFDADAQVLLPFVAVDDGMRAFAHESLDRLRPGYGTNFSAALARVQSAHQRVPRRSGGAARALLLTDGYPSMGTTDPRALLATVERLRHGGLTLSAAGFGEYDATLLSALGETGEGQFHDARDANALGAIVRREVDGLLDAALTRVTLELELDPGVERAAVIHALPHLRTQRSIRITLGELSVSSPRSVLLQTSARSRIGRLRASGAAPGGDAAYFEEQEVLLEGSTQADVERVASEWLAHQLSAALIEGWHALAHGRRAARARFEAGLAIAHVVAGSLDLEEHPLARRVEHALEEVHSALSVEALRDSAREDTAYAHGTRVSRVVALHDA